MLDQSKLVDGTASFKRTAQKEFDKALAELIALAFRYAKAGADFLWDMDPQLDAEANQILRNLSDTLAEKAKAIARAVVMDAISGYDFDQAWDRDDFDAFVPIVTRLDLEGSHLKELLEIWLALAFVNNISKGELRVLISRYLANPYASPLWNGLPRDLLKWGRGYAKNILEQITVIGQNAIVSAARFAEWQDALDNGNTYYIRRRGSGYDCKVCEDMANKPIPISVPFEVPHPRCMCWPEFHKD